MKIRDVKRTLNERGSAVASRRAAKPTPRARAAEAAKARSSLADCAFTGPEARLLLEALTSLKQGDPKVRLPLEWTGIQGKLAETFNEVVDLNERITAELARLRNKVGREGKIKQRAEVPDARGFWREKIVHVNELIDDL